MRLIHAAPALPVFDLARAVAFYRGAFGFVLEVEGPGFAIIRRDAVALHLWPSDDESWKARAHGQGENPVRSGAESFLSGTASCRIRVEDIRALHASAEAAGAVHPNGPLKRAGWPAWEFAALDPDGNCLTFYQPD